MEWGCLWQVTPGDAQKVVVQSPRPVTQWEPDVRFAEGLHSQLESLLMLPPSLCGTKITHCTYWLSLTSTFHFPRSDVVILFCSRHNFLDSPSACKQPYRETFWGGMRKYGSCESGGNARGTKIEHDSPNSNPYNIEHFTIQIQFELKPSLNNGAPRGGVIHPSRPFKPQEVLFYIPVKTLVLSRRPKIWMLNAIKLCTNVWNTLRYCAESSWHTVL